jgi:hypothetical protein
VIETAKKTHELPPDFSLTYAPDLLTDAFITWAKAGYVESSMNPEEIAWSNQTLRHDLNLFLIAVDFVATEGSSDNE